MSTTDFVELWAEGENSFESDPPNAVLSFIEPGDTVPEDTVIVIKKPRLTNGSLTYTIDVLEGTVPAKAGPDDAVHRPIRSPVVARLGLRRASPRAQADAQADLSHPQTQGAPMADSAETPVLDLLAAMTAGSVEASSLDPETFMLVRIAALIAVDAPPVSYVLNLGAAGDLDVDADRVAGVLAAVAPIVGTARVASALGHIVKALELELEIAELEQESKA